MIYILTTQLFCIYTLFKIAKYKAHLKICYSGFLKKICNEVYASLVLCDVTIHMTWGSPPDGFFIRKRNLSFTYPNNIYLLIIYTINLRILVPEWLSSHPLFVMPAIATSSSVTCDILTLILDNRSEREN